jgi:hypothetical protein
MFPNGMQRTLFVLIAATMTAVWLIVTVGVPANLDWTQAQAVTESSVASARTVIG